MINESGKIELFIQLNGSDFKKILINEIIKVNLTPFQSIIKSLEIYLTYKINQAHGNAILKKPVIKIHDNYSKNEFATLDKLKNDGFETWNIEIYFSSKKDIIITGVNIAALHFELRPVYFYRDEFKIYELKSNLKKRQINYKLKIFNLVIPPDFFVDLYNCLKLNNYFLLRYIANYKPGPHIKGYRMVSFDRLFSGERSFCSCARLFHQAINSKLPELLTSYQNDSWPFQIQNLLSNIKYDDGICHLCLARNQIKTESNLFFYGIGFELHYSSYIDQVKFDLGVDETTALSEVKMLFGLSRWVRESELYKIIRELFPENTILREATFEWLGRMRLDIYVRELKLAFEYQGEQHYRPVSIFGGAEGFTKTLERDELKRKLCEENGVRLIYVKHDAPLTKASIRNRLLKYLAS